MNDKFEMIKDRIAHILRAKNLTATQFAEMMQIQPSNVSHILNGRNKPSLDFITKLKEVFPEYSFDWIITGKKPITISERNLFSKEANEEDYDDTRFVESKGGVREQQVALEFNPITTGIHHNDVGVDSHVAHNGESALKQIIYVFEDRTFEVYNVRK